MVDSEIAALLRALIDEFSSDEAAVDSAIRSPIVSKLLEAAGNEDSSVDGSARPGREKLRRVPTMWR
jgi:hypothetical protein